MLAVPGEITSALSAGTNALLRLGATPVTSVADVLESFGIEAAAPEPSALGPVATQLLDRLREGARTADELVRATGVEAAAAAAALLELELSRAVELDDGVYRASI